MENNIKSGPQTAGHSGVKPRVMTPQSSVNFPKTHPKTAQNGEKQYKKRVMRAVFALRVPVKIKADNRADEHFTRVHLSDQGEVCIAH